LTDGEVSGVVVVELLLVDREDLAAIREFETSGENIVL